MWSRIGSKRIIGSKRKVDSKDEAKDEANEEQLKDSAAPALPQDKILIDITAHLNNLGRSEVGLLSSVFLQHVLFTLSLISCPWDQLPVQEESHKSRGRFQLDKFLFSINLLLDDCMKITTATNVSSFLIGFGPSIHNLRFSFVLHFPTPRYSEAMTTSDDKRARLRDRMKRQFLMRLVEHDSQLSAFRLPPTGQLFVCYSVESTHNMENLQTLGGRYYACNSFKLPLIGSKRSKRLDLQLEEPSSEFRGELWLVPVQGVKFTRGLQF